MSKKIDLRGQRFGRLTVLCEDGRTKDGKVKWKCQCDCGNIASVLGKCLRNGVTKSCGCLQKDRARECMETHGLTSVGSSRRLYISVATHFRSIREGLSGYKGWVLDPRYTDDTKGIAKFCADLLEIQPDECRRYEMDKSLDLDKDNGEKVFCPEIVRFRELRENRSKQYNNIMLKGGVRLVDLCHNVGVDYHSKSLDKYRQWAKRYGDGHPELVQKANELIALYTKTLKMVKLLEDARRLRACV